MHSPLCQFLFQFQPWVFEPDADGLRVHHRDLLHGQPGLEVIVLGVDLHLSHILKKIIQSGRLVGAVDLMLLQRLDLFLRRLLLVHEGLELGVEAGVLHVLQHLVQQQGLLCGDVRQLLPQGEQCGSIALLPSPGQSGNSSRSVFTSRAAWANSLMASWMARWSFSSSSVGDLWQYWVPYSNREMHRHTIRFLPFLAQVTRL